MHQLKELKQLQKMNQRLCRAVSSLTLDKLILSEAANGNLARRRNCIDFVNYVMFISKRLINCGLFVFAILQRIVLGSHLFEGPRICLSNIPT